MRLKIEMFTVVVCSDQRFRRRAFRPYSGPGGLLREGRQQRDPAGAAGRQLPAPERHRAP